MAKRMWRNARLATMADAGLGRVEQGVVACEDGIIIYAGPAADAPRFDDAELLDCEGRWITPGLIDCHTHLVHGGNRANEFAMRLDGAGYEDIARAGGGILSTMRATRAASETALVDQALPRLDALLAEGVTTVEIKSGYGLTLADECKMLRAAGQLGVARDVGIVRTFLGAHAVPPEFAGDADGYIAMICQDMLPAVAAEGLADAVDAFCEGIGFTPVQTQSVFQAAQALGLPIRLHAEQLSALGGASLAARHGALSADHLEHATPADVAEMASAGTVAVLLPGAYYFMRETQLPPIAVLRAAGVPIALATDCNPGTSPLTSPLLVLNMAATLFHLTVEEALRGMTINAARALGRSESIGSLKAGKACDLAIWSIDDPAELVYRIGFNPLHARIRNGR